jgi:hypothetical protein
LPFFTQHAFEDMLAHLAKLGFTRRLLAHLAGD